MRRRGFIINATLVIVVAVIVYIIGFSYGNVEVGAYVLLPDGSEISDSEYTYKELLSSLEVDSYGVRFGDVLHYESLNQISLSLFSSKSADDEQYVLKAYDFLTGKEISVVRTGTKTKLYHAYENIYLNVDSSYSGTVVLDVLNTRGNILERIKMRIY